MAKNASPNKTEEDKTGGVGASPSKCNLDGSAPIPPTVAEKVALLEKMPAIPVAPGLPAESKSDVSRPSEYPSRGVAASAAAEAEAANFRT